MTIKWVTSDPLVMNGEPFCYATRLTVRNILQMRASGLTPAQMLAQHPELRRVGIGEAFLYAVEHRERYEAFFDAGGSLRGPGFSPAVRCLTWRRPPRSQKSCLDRRGVARTSRCTISRPCQTLL
jgi:uncharacterized protein (DUF433 family)